MGNLIDKLNGITTYNDWTKESLYVQMEDEVKNIIVYGKDKKGNDKKENANQLRNIFNLFSSTFRKINKNDDNVNLQILKARITYIYSKGNIHNKLHNVYKKLIEKIAETKPLDKNDKKKWIENVRKFVEAFYAYSYLHAKKD